MEVDLTKNPGIYALMADFILSHDAMLEAIAVAGEIIALDARLQDYGGVLSRHIGLNDPGNHFEFYEATLERCKRALTEYSSTKDARGLLSGLVEIQQALAELSIRE